jgi:hypothetical protein
MVQNESGKDGPFPLNSSSRKGELVRTVESVEARWVKLNKVSILIDASGTTTTTGWTNGRLEPVRYVQPPPDKIWEFNFFADPPAGGSGDAITPIKAQSYQWTNPPGDVLGIRVVAATNKMEAKPGG